MLEPTEVRACRSDPRQPTSRVDEMSNLPRERVPRADIIVRIVIVLVNGAFDVISHYRCTTNGQIGFFCC